eukprot:81377-Pyramimonas_sp.AAC.1
MEHRALLDSQKLAGSPFVSRSTLKADAVHAPEDQNPEQDAAEERTCLTHPGGTPNIPWPQDSTARTL